MTIGTIPQLFGYIARSDEKDELRQSCENGQPLEEKIYLLPTAYIGRRAPHCGQHQTHGN